MRIVSTIKKYRVDIMLVVVLFMLAFGIRIMPAGQFPNIYGFDSYWAARMTKYLITGEGLAAKGWPLVNVPDYTTDYPYGRQGTLANELGFWMMNANLYKVAASLSGTQGFDYGLFGHIASWMNAVYGALAIPALYLFGRIAFGRWTGLASALFLAVSSNHLFYSIFGHSENDALGFSLFFLSLFALAATMKLRDIRLGFIATFFLTWTSIVWQTYEVVAISVAGMVVLYFLIFGMLNQIGYYKNTPDRQQHRKWMIYGLLFALPSTVLTTVLTRSNYGAVGIACFAGAILVTCLVEMAVSGRGFRPSLRTLYPDKALIIAVVALLLGGLVYGTELVRAPLGRMGLDISFGPAAPPMQDYEVRMVQTIAEQNPVGGSNFMERLGTLANSGFGFTIWLSLLASLVAIGKICVMPLFRKDFTYEWDILIIVFILPSPYMLTSRSVNIFFLAAATALGAGYIIGTLLRACELLGSRLARAVVPAKGAVFAVMLAMFFAFSMLAIPTADGFGYDVNTEWWSVFAYLNSPAVPNGSVVTAWWDYGHWMAYFNGEKLHVSQDNIQDRKDIIYTVASSFTHTVDCSYDQTSKQITCASGTDDLERAELESLSLLKPLKTTHILIDAEIVGGSTGGKFGALKHIAANEIGCMQTVWCSPQGNNTACILGKDKDGNNVGFTFTPEHWTLMTTVPWPGVNMVQQGLPSRIFGRDTSGGKMLYMSAISCGNPFQPDANSPVLYGFAQRLFFRDTNLKHVKLVYDDGWNVIYEVNWKGVPDPQNYTAWTKSRSVLPESG